MFYSFIPVAVYTQDFSQSVANCNLLREGEDMEEEEEDEKMEGVNNVFRQSGWPGSSVINIETKLTLYSGNMK
ncbi:hypothetical protein SK128_027119 [Halocaridina rubra]|uniref:Uncharacterized protein n=1 Tax=Halocaridina rubra TaxID=373956 RepID=A0AAN8WUK7_HALRR